MRRCILLGAFVLADLLAHASAVPDLNELAGNWQDAAKVRCLPAINSTQGSAQAVRDVLALGNLSFPPITMTGDTGRLLIDDVSPTVSRTRWFPFQILRQAAAENLAIETATRLVYEQKGVLFHVAITNTGSASRAFELKIVLHADTSQHAHWGWKVPRDKETNRFSAVPLAGGKSLLLRDSRGELANCFAFVSKPDELLTDGSRGEAVWHLSLAPGASATVNYVFSAGLKEPAVETLAAKWAADFDATFAKVERDWQERFEAMFTPGNRWFSGNLPTLETTNERVRRVYYMSIVSLLSVYRTCFPTAPRVYVSNTPESNCTMMYFWDTREWATVFALLDPETLKNCLRSWLAKGIYNGYAEEYLTGTLQGPWYSANDYSVFILLDNYLNVTGDRAFLGEKISGQTVLEQMDSIATHWKQLVQPGRTLADYGKPSNLLECVPTYINEVPSFNAANVLDDAARGRHPGRGGKPGAGQGIARGGGSFAARRHGALRARPGRVGFAAPRRLARANAPCI